MAKLVEQLPGGACCTDENGVCVEVNQRWLELTGFSREGVVGRPLREFVHPDDVGRVLFTWAEHRKQGQRCTLEYRYRLLSGHDLWVQAEASAEPLANSPTPIFLWCVSDTTMLHAVQEELRQMQATLEDRVREQTQQLREAAMIIEQADDAVLWCDLAGRIVGWNQAAERIFGYARTEVLGGSAMAITPADQQAEALEFERRVRLGEAIHHREVWRSTKGGARVPILLSMFPLRGPSGVIVGGAALLRDLTSQKKVERGLRELSARLLKAQDEERRRIARELHDSTAQLLAALSIDLGRLCMASQTMDEKARTELLGECCLLADRATAEIRTHSYLLHPPLLEERGLCAALRFYLDGFAERSGVQVDFRGPAALRLDSAAELTLFRIVQEALGNVVRHSKSDRAEITFSQRRGRVELEIRDFGCGLPPDQHELNGVGVAGMRERVAQLGGTFVLESATPGLKIRVSLPMTNNL